MPELVVRRPLGEPDLRDEVRADPVGRLVGLHLLGERRRLRLARLQELRDARELLLIESSAGVADVSQPAVLLDAQQQPPEVLPRQPRLGPAADDAPPFLEARAVSPPPRALTRLLAPT